VYGFAKCMPDGGEKLFGYLASTPRRDKQDEIRFTTDLILDYTRAGLKGYFEGKASSIFDASGRPLWFSLQTWRGGKRYTFVTRITASEASIQETGGGKTLVKLESGSILFFESLHNHWSLFFSRLDPALIKRMPIHVLVLQHKRLYRWNLIHRGREEVLVPALDKTVNAHIFDVPERNFRFWVTDARVLVKVEDRRAEITVRLEKESLRERF